MWHDDAHEETGMPKISKRFLLKGIIVFAAAGLLVPLEQFVQYLFGPNETGPVTYPRVRVANTKDVTANDSLPFEYPHKDRPAILIRLPLDSFVGYDALCTHLGCQVHYNKVAVKGWEDNPRQIFSPCHGGVFDPATGKVLSGPPPRPLPKIRLEIDDKGDIYANGYESGLPLYGEG